MEHSFYVDVFIDIWPVHPHDADGKKRFREAEEWIMRGGNDWIFSFDNVCELLGLDPEYVRRGLRETLGTPAEEEKLVHRDRMRRRAA